MNLIGNNCVAAAIYKINNIQYNSPFFWMNIHHNEFIYLIKHYDEINFNNFTCSLEDYYDFIKTTKINIDNKLELHYLHYRLSDNELQKKGINVFSKNIIEYTKEKYITRLNRKSKEPPIFLYSFSGIKEDFKNYDDFLNEILSITDKKIIIIIHPNKIKEHIVPNNIKIIELEMNKETSVFTIAKKINLMNI